MATAEDPAVLWCLRGHGRDVRCLSQKTRSGFELRVLWGDELFLTETFHEGERLQRRAEEFKATLEARGWTRLPVAGTPPAPDPGATPDESAIRVPDDVVAGRGKPLGERPTVLLVDDETTVRSFLRAYLEEGGYLVTESADVDSALTALDQGPVDAVVLDVRMPDPMGWGRTGLEVLAFIRLHAAFTSLPVMILTGQPLTSDEQDLVRRHRAHLFMKPDGYRTLLQRLGELTKGRERTR